MDGSPRPADPRSRRRLLTVLRLCMAFSVLLYAGIGWYLENTGKFVPSPLPSPAGDYVKWALLAATVVLFPILRARRRALHEKPAGGGGAGPDLRVRGEAVFRAYVVFFALAEAAAMFGLVLFLLGQPLRTLLLTCGLSLFYLAAMTPPADLERGAPSF